MVDRLSHNSHLLVIRKRATPRSPKVRGNAKQRRSMTEMGVRPLLTPAQLLADPATVLDS